MPETARVWIEILFNVSYLVVVWTLVVLMYRNMGVVAIDNRLVAKRFLWAFALLALGDTGHVGFRVLAYARGGLEENPSLVGMGALSTAITVTLFYMIILDIWRLHFNKPLGRFGGFLLSIGVIRLAIMAFPQNQWDLLIAPYNWSLFRNALLMIQGLGVMFLILRDAGQHQDRAFQWIGWMIAVSFLFYAPVILWVAQVPALGMLMIPKTCAYVGIAVIAYQSIYVKSAGKQTYHPWITEH